MTPWTTARQASLSFTISQSLLKLMSIESVMPSNHLILCRPLLQFIFPDLSDETAGNLIDYDIWKMQIEKKCKCFYSAYKSMIYQITVGHN